MAQGNPDLVDRYPAKLKTEPLLKGRGDTPTIQYTFEGSLDIDQFSQAVNMVHDAVPKFRYYCDYLTMSWVLRPADFDYGDLVTKGSDVDELREELTKRFEPIETCAFRFGVVEEDEGTFTLLMTYDHSQFDGVGAVVMTNMSVDVYNCLISGESYEELLHTCRGMVDAPIEEVRPVGFGRKVALFWRLHRMKITDSTHFCPTVDEVTDIPRAMGREKRREATRLYDLNPLLVEGVSKNSLVTSIFTKAVANAVGTQEYIGHMTLATGLPETERSRYVGNYTGAITHNLPAAASIEENARLVHEELQAGRRRKTIEAFMWLFDATAPKIDKWKGDEVLRSVKKDPTLFCLTNWSNWRFANDPEYIKGCRSIEMSGRTGGEPRLENSQVINKPFALICMCPGNKVNLRIEAPLEDQLLPVMDELDKIFGCKE